MFFAKIESGVATVYPLTEKEVRRSLDTVALPKNLTNEILEPLGFAIVESGKVEDFPKATIDQMVVIDTVYKSGNVWNRTYKLIPVPESLRAMREENAWAKIRKKRDSLMNAFEWRIQRCIRETSLGIPPHDSIDVLHQYMQALADITKQPDPYLITFPEEPK